MSRPAKRERRTWTNEGAEPPLQEPRAVEKPSKARLTSPGESCRGATVGGELGSTIVLEASVAGRSRPRFVKKRAKTHKPTLSWPSRPKQP